MSDPFGYGYAVSHIDDPFLTPLVMVMRSVTSVTPFCLWWWLCGQSLRTIGSDTTDRLYFFIYDMGYGSDTT